MVSFPYPKLCTANMQVDQGAGYIVCSVEAARAAGVPEDRWVFPLAGADANDHWFISHRPELHRSPAIRLAGAAALTLAGLGIDDVASVDLYSCFPAVVQMAAAELGLAVDDPARPLTLTGGLTFGGGPGNNYTSHGIARAVGALRAIAGCGGAGDGTGLVRHEALGRCLRVAAARAWATGPSPGATSSPRWTPCRSAPWTRGGERPGAGRDLHGHLRPRRGARAGHRGLPHRGRRPGLGQHRPTPTRWRSSASRRASGGVGCWRRTGFWSSRTEAERRAGNLGVYRRRPTGIAKDPVGRTTFSALSVVIGTGSARIQEQQAGYTRETRARRSPDARWRRWRRWRAQPASMPRVRTVADTSTALRSGNVPSTWSARCMVTPNQ